MRCKRVFAVILVISCLVAAITIGIVSLINYQHFWEASATQVLTLIVAICVAFWVTQFKTDVRKKKDHAEQLLKKIQTLATSETFCRVSITCDKDNHKKQIMINNRSLSNAIGLLQKYAKELRFVEDANYIESQFKEYRSFVSEHIEDIDYLSKSETTMRKYSENIDNKCDLIIMEL